MASEDKAEPFPSLTPINTASQEDQDAADRDGTDVPGRRASNASRTGDTPRRTRGASLLQSFVQSNPPLGMWQATGEVGSKMPTLPEIKNGAFAADGWSHEGQMEHRGTNPHEIHRRRQARTSSASTRTRGTTKSSVTTPGTPTIRESRHEFFPKRASISMKQQPLVEETPSRPEEPSHTTEPDSQNQIPEKLDMVETAEAASSTASNEQQVVHTHSTGPDETGTYPNGYRFPKKHTWSQSTVIGLKAFWKFVCTPFGFAVTIYGLNVVAWGAMIFFVLLNAAPAMCHPSCSADSSARKIWIEIDSQILNALFCVTGFGLIPWRFRDFYYLMQWRLRGSQIHHRRLAGIYRGWYRLPGSDRLADDIGPPPVYSKKHPQTEESPPPYTPEQIHVLEQNPSIPIPATAMPEPPLTGIRATPSRSWTIDMVVWMYLMNTMFQICLASFMWVYNRFTRPSWATGLFITLGCLTGIFAGIVVFIEGTRVKKAEGIPVQEYDVLESVEDYQERHNKEMEKEQKKIAKQESHDSHHHHQHRKNGKDKDAVQEKPVLVRTQTHKMKGEQWFTRH